MGVGGGRLCGVQVNSEQVSLESFAETGEHFCGPEISREEKMIVSTFFIQPFVTVTVSKLPRPVLEKFPPKKPIRRRKWNLEDRIG